MPPILPPGPHDGPWVLNRDDAWADGWRARLSFVARHEAAGGAVEVRRLLLRVGGGGGGGDDDDDAHAHAHARPVWHLLYRRWPDFGVPALDDMDGFFELMRLSRRYSPGPAPRVVHCSAGVGRTGTFICLEHLMRELDAGAFDALDAPPPAAAAAAASDPVFDAVESLRQQRRGMVQGEVQYRFLYHVVRRLWRARHGLPDHDPAAGPRDEPAEPAPKRLEMADPFTDDDAPPPPP